LTDGRLHDEEQKGGKKLDESMDDYWEAKPRRAEAGKRKARLPRPMKRNNSECMGRESVLVPYIFIMLKQNKRISSISCYYMYNYFYSVRLTEAMVLSFPRFEAEGYCFSLGK
jgi:hypothetical protein